jgi:hypothetical protein
MWWNMDTYRYAQLYSRLACLLMQQIFTSKGLDAHQTAFAIKKYELHHCVGLATEVIQLMEAQIAFKKAPKHF